MKVSIDNSFLRTSPTLRATIVHQVLSVMVMGLCLLQTATTARGQASGKPVPYGSNPCAGHFLQVGDATLYYEVYGSGGRPLVLLHGGLYGSIGEFSALIDETSKHRRVIAI